MILNLTQIQSITKGAVRIEEIDGAVQFHRFNREQEELYRQTNADFYKKSFATSGVRLEFITDSPTLSMEVRVSASSSRKFFSHDITVNGTLISAFGSQASATGTYAHTCALGDGTKTVCIYFPWSVCSLLTKLELADGSTLTPVAKSRRMLIYGDSITQGYDATLTSQAYATRLTDLLDAEAINRGIGGERFFPALAEASGELSPDVITVAYGTNDWSKSDSYETFATACADFYGTLSRLYPTAKIFAITPIWRKDGDRITNVGEFSITAKTIKEVAATLSNVVAIDGYDFVPHDSAYFYDLRLHPNDEGFAHYVEHLYAEIQKYI